MAMTRLLPSMSALTAFEAAARHLNFTRAAEDLGLTQSGISRQVQILEDLLGTRLFDRIGPRIVLTDVGKLYAEEVTQLLGQIEQASLDAVRGWPAETALVVGASSSVASRWLAPRMDSYAAQFSDTFFDIVPVSNEIDFTTTPLDVAILRGRGNWSGAQASILFDEQMIVVASPALAGPDVRLEPGDFIRFTQLQNSGRPDAWMKWLHATGQKNKGPLQGPRFAHTSMLVNAAISGLGIALVPAILVERELKSGTLTAPFGPAVPSGETYFAAFPERKSTRKAIRIFRDWLVAETRDLRKA